MFDKGQKQSSTLSCDSSYFFSMHIFMGLNFGDLRTGMCKNNVHGLLMDIFAAIYVCEIFSGVNGKNKISLYCVVCGGPGRKPKLSVFSSEGSIDLQ